LNPSGGRNYGKSTTKMRTVEHLGMVTPAKNKHKNSLGRGQGGWTPGFNVARKAIAVLSGGRQLAWSEGGKKTQGKKGNAEGKKKKEGKVSPGVCLVVKNQKKRTNYWFPYFLGAMSGLKEIKGKSVKGKKKHS